MGFKRFSKGTAASGGGGGGNKRFKSHDDATASGNDNILDIDIGSNKKITVREFKGTALVDVREYYTKDSEPGEKLPGKKGISLTESVWQELLSHQQEVSDAFASLKKAEPDDSKADDSKTDEDKVEEKKSETDNHQESNDQATSEEE
ncbi:PC4-domain-containing protein [Lipomyces japonicus]|uniref:PC4-domain-containing protein n=1 Tax=Lipomyces japonicus TaxID=56871 RepID=UPI0034CF83C2